MTELQIGDKAALNLTPATLHEIPHGPVTPSNIHRFRRASAVSNTRSFGQATFPRRRQTVKPAGAQPAAQPERASPAGATRRKAHGRSPSASSLRPVAPRADRESTPVPDCFRSDAASGVPRWDERNGRWGSGNSCAFPNAAVAATKEGQSTRGVLLSEWCC